MTRAKELLDAATPLPWRQADTDDEGTGILAGPELSIDEGQVAWAESFGSVYPSAHNAALIVYAVNRLPDYEAAVEALFRLEGAVQDYIDDPKTMTPLYPEVRNAREALARLRDEVPHKIELEGSIV